MAGGSCWPCERLTGDPEAGVDPGDGRQHLGEHVVVPCASPTVVREQLKAGLPGEPGQVHTRVAPRYAELRTHVYEQIQAARRGAGQPVRTDPPPPH